MSTQIRSGSLSALSDTWKVTADLAAAMRHLRQASGAAAIFAIRERQRTDDPVAAGLARAAGVGAIRAIGEADKALKAWDEYLTVAMEETGDGQPGR